MTSPAERTTAAIGVRSPIRLLKTALQLGWSLWFTVVLCTNLLDALQVAKVLPQWGLPAGNFESLRSATALYHVPVWSAWLLFLVLLVWQMAIVALFWRSAISVWSNGGRDNRAVHWAYLVALPLWLAFMVACEVFLAWGNEPEFIRDLTAQLLTLFAIVLLPE